MMTKTRHSLLPGSIFFAILIASFLGLIASRMDFVSIKKDELHSEIRNYILENPEIVFEAVAIIRQREAYEEDERDKRLVETHREELYNDGLSYVGGNPDGDITLVEFLDYRCGYCRKAYNEVEALLREDGKIRFVIKEFPILGDNSTTSAQFAIAVKQLHGMESYKAIHDTLIASNGDPTRQVLVEIASAFGFDPIPIIERMTTDDVMQEINLNRALGQKMQISGTPTFVLGDQLLRGYLTLDEMLEMIKAQRGQ